MIDDDHIESKESQSLERAKTEMKEQLFNEIFQKIKQEQSMQSTSQAQTIQVSHPSSVKRRGPDYRNSQDSEISEKIKRAEKTLKNGNQPKINNQESTKQQF